MSLPNVPAPLTDPRFDQVMLHLNAAKAILDEDGFDIALTEEQIRETTPVADHFDGYIAEAAQSAAEYSDSLPGNFPLEDLTASAKTYSQSRRIKEKLLQLERGPHFTSILSGSRARGYCDTLYDIFKGVARFNGALTEVVKSLGEYFKGQGKRPSQNPNPTGTNRP